MEHGRTRKNTEKKQEQPPFSVFFNVLFFSVCFRVPSTPVTTLWSL